MRVGCIGQADTVASSQWHMKWRQELLPPCCPDMSGCGSYFSYIALDVLALAARQLGGGSKTCTGETALYYANSQIHPFLPLDSGLL